MEKELQLKIYVLIVLIFSILGAILLLATEFAGWSYYGYSAYWDSDRWSYDYSYDSGSVYASTPGYGIIVILDAIPLFYCAFIAILALFFQDKIPSKMFITLALIMALVTLVITILGAIAFIIIVSLDDLTWRLGAGFYGGLIGSIVTFIFLIFVHKNIEL